MADQQFGLVTTSGGFGPTGIFSCDVQIFQFAGLSQAWQMWNKPRGATIVNFYTMSGGGGGGAGFTRAAGGPGGGGGGGACSNTQRLLSVPAFVLPDLLYVQVGPGGLGGVPGVSSGNGGAGSNSFVCWSKTAVIPHILAYSGVNAPGGGGGGAVGAAGSAGTVPTVPVLQPFQATWGNNNATVGLVGVAGGAHTGANGANVTCWGSQGTLSPGAGGGGIATTSDTNGGAQNLSNDMDFGAGGKLPNSTGGVAMRGVPGAVNGSRGFSSWKPFFQSGGAGGATSNAGQAGNGGDGGIGCGGGGGGAGATGGNGGNGGSGLVVIVSL